MIKTIEELYKDSVKNGYEQYELQVQYSDDGGYYEGTRQVEIVVDAEKKTVII